MRAIPSDDMAQRLEIVFFVARDPEPPKRNLGGSLIGSVVEAAFRRPFRTSS
jgi:hypothetical protein